LCSEIFSADVRPAQKLDTSTSRLFSKIRYVQKQGKTDSTIAGRFRHPTEKFP
jgi:hypothetical protein